MTVTSRLRLYTIAQTLNDDALTTIASRGLVRRAKKDLESAPPVWDEDSAEMVIDQCRVTLAENPAQSRCTCAATGVCRHIVAAWIFLRDNALADGRPVAKEGLPSSPSLPESEIVAIDEDALRTWAGKKTFQKARELLAKGMAVQIECAKSGVIVRFPQGNLVCRWLPQGGFGGMLCSCHTPEVCVHRVAAVLAVQIAHGKRLPESEGSARGASLGAPRTREEVRAAVGGVLCEMVSLGLSRLSSATRDRVQTLATSAHGVDLPRFERSLQSLADAIARSLNRSARASSDGLLATAARVEALRTSLAHPTSAVVGEHRSRYAPVGDLRLQGLGARRWRSTSGYLGLTVFFWDESASNWATWSDVRPADVGGFEPLARYRAFGPWQGCPSPEIASRSCLQLADAWRNAVGRLSARAASWATIEASTDWLSVPRLTSDWRDVSRQAVRAFGSGLHDRSEQDEIVLLAPRGWGEASFDAIRQEFVRPMADRDGRLLALVLPFLQETEHGLPYLEGDEVRSARAVLGLLRHRQGRLSVEPVSLIEDHQIVNLTLDGSPKTMRVTRDLPAAEAPGEAPSDPQVSFALAHSGTAVGAVLNTTLAELEAVAELGVAADHDMQRLQDAARQMRRVGLATTAAAVERVLVDLERTRKSRETGACAQAAQSLLRAYYVARLAAEHEALLAAIG